MGNYTNEKGMVVFQESFLTKIKNFFAKAFWNRRSKYQMMEDYDNYYDEDNSENYSNQESINQENAQKERRLYNFDADNNDDWPENENMSKVDVNEENEAYNDNNGENRQEQTLEEKYDREIYSEAYIEKQELEQKLLNYYESIKKRFINKKDVLIAFL